MENSLTFILRLSEIAENAFFVVSARMKDVATRNSSLHFRATKAGTNALFERFILKKNCLQPKRTVLPKRDTLYFKASFRKIEDVSKIT